MQLKGRSKRPTGKPYGRQDSDGRSELLAAIQAGAQLRHVPEGVKAGAHLHDVPEFQKAKLRQTGRPVITPKASRASQATRATTAGSAAEANAVLGAPKAASFDGQPAWMAGANGAAAAQPAGRKPTYQRPFDKENYAVSGSELSAHPEKPQPWPSCAAHAHCDQSV
jgi:hypothetical protein